MLNLKKYYKTLLSDSALTDALNGGQILSAYPDEIETFPLIIYEDTNQSDREYADNLPQATKAQVRVHIFTKSLSGYPTTTTLGVIIHNLFRADFWACTLNSEVAESEENIKHRVMDFTRDFYEI